LQTAKPGEATANQMLYLRLYVVALAVQCGRVVIESSVKGLQRPHETQSMEQRYNKVRAQLNLLGYTQLSPDF
jgi:hypothetical protein